MSSASFTPFIKVERAISLLMQYLYLR